METHATIWVRSTGRIKSLKWLTETRVKILVWSNGWIESYGHFTRCSILADQTTSSPSYDSIATQGKQPPKTRANIWARSNGGIKNNGHFNPLLKSGQIDLFVTE
jgi:hypothetical protein